MILRPMTAGLFLTAAGLALAPGRAFGEPASLTQLRLAADAAANAASAPGGEAAAAGNERWAENGGGAAAVAAPSAAGETSAAAIAPPAPRPTLAADLPPIPPTAEPKSPEPDPLPPTKPTGWQGFYLGALGVEGAALSKLSGTGKAAIPLLILLQPIVLPVALVGGLLGLFGVRL
jgi:hypothetical protein